MKRLRYAFAATFAAIGAAGTTGAAFAEDRERSRPQVMRVDGQACQGANYFNGGVVADYANTASFLEPPVFAFWTQGVNGGPFSVPEVGAINPQTGMGEPITAATPYDWIMGGLSDLFFELFLGITADPGVTDTPLHEMPVITGPRGTIAVIEDGEPVVRNVREQVPLGGDARTVSRNAKLNFPITVERWNEADGRAFLGCRPDGTGWVKLTATKLIPQMPYTVWSVHADNTLPVEGLPIIPNPLGGVPNTVIPDQYGRATYERELDWCPLDTGDTPLMYIAFLLHSDQMVYGAYFDQSGLDAGAALPIGAVAADHVCIPVGAHLQPPKTKRKRIRRRASVE